MKKVKEIVAQMTLEDKIRLCSGATFWQSEQMDQYGLPSFFMSDGPHGLRTQKGEADHLGVNKSEESTCFPTACASSASWDPELLHKMGRAIAEEALAYNVDIVLGPGVNIKRNPLCGRNFEYFSEDPYLAGALAKAWIDGVQEMGVGTSLKHFAANNQEEERMLSNSIVDERALREIYLAGFETAVKESKPETVMCSYNLINGVYPSDNKWLLTDVLRDEWGFDGFVMTDWGALNNRIAAIKAGCDLEMPGSGKMFDAEVKQAVEDGSLSETALNAVVERLVAFALKAADVREKHAKAAENPNAFDVEGHHALAKEIAGKSAVLLKNDGKVLPLSQNSKIALCGAMAETVRYQGAGSSHINPTRLSSLKQSMEMLGGDVSYYPAYELNGDADAQALSTAVEGAKNADVAVLVIGLPDVLESEGYDRKHMQIPQSHQELVRVVAEVNPNVVVVLMGGSPIEMPWINSAKAVLNLYLGGQAVGEAAAELLYGKINPSGKLAETYPMAYSDCSSSETFGVNPRQVEYAESIYVGYRYYDKAQIPVRFPFGHGLSYTEFTYSDLTIATQDRQVSFADGKLPGIRVSCKVKNTGAVAGAEVAQLYVSDRTPEIFKAEKELKGFAKIYLQPGEEKEVIFILDKRSFAHYDVETRDWEVLSGTYNILVGASSADIRLREAVTVAGTVEKLPYKELPVWYARPQGKPPVADFEKVYGQEIKPYKPQKPGEFTLMNTFNDMKDNPAVQQIMNAMKAGMLQGKDENDPEMIFLFSIVFNTPLIRQVQQSAGQSPLGLMQMVVACANGQMSAEQLAAMMSGQGQS